jgi:hypothetical protein
MQVQIFPFYNLTTNKMKALTRLVFLLILVFVTINTLAQNGLEGKKSVYLQLGASGGYSPNLSQPVLIPQLGLDATLGIIGFRANGQFFKTTPEFDINGYLDPIKSVITISNQQEKNSNILLGFSPYLSFGKKAISIQPGVGIKYLMQKGATATAVYNQPPGTSILKFPDGDANRNLFIIEPNIRASFGKPGNFLRFFLEAGYSIPQGSNEFSFTSRSIPNVVDPRGNVDVKALLNSKQVTSTENTIPAFASIGAGIEIKLFSANKPDKVIMIQESDYYKSLPLKNDTIQLPKADSIKMNDDNENELIYLYSYSWVRNCPEPPGGQEYFSYVLDGNFTYIKYEGCSGGYHEWFYSSFRQNDNPVVIAGNDVDIKESFIKLVETNKKIRKDSNISIEELENSMDNAFNEFIIGLETNNIKGVVLKSKFNKKTNDEVSREDKQAFASFSEVEPVNNIMANGCRTYTQSYTIRHGNCLEDYTCYTWICPNGTHQWIIRWGCPETQSNSSGRLGNTGENDSLSIYPVIINDKRINFENKINDENVKMIASILSKFKFELFKTLPANDIDNIFCNVTTEVKNYFGDKLIKYRFEQQDSEPLIPDSDHSKIDKFTFKELQNYLLSLYSLTTINNYRIYDDGIKLSTTIPIVGGVLARTFTSVNNYGINDDGIKLTGEPVPAAEIYIVLEAELGGEPIANVITDENGEFTFETVNIPNFPTHGTLILTITPSKAFARGKNLPIKKDKIRVRFNKAEEETFRFTLFWYEIESKTQNKGCFAVSGKNSTKSN